MERKLIKMSPFTPRKYLTVAALVLASLATGCGILQALEGKAVTEVKTVAGDTIENKAIATGIDLKGKYGIDLVNDSPQAQIMKIVNTEIKAGNGDLAAALSDVSKVQTIGEAISVVTSWAPKIAKDVKDGTLTAGAGDSATNAAKGLGTLAALNAGIAALAYLRGNKFKDAVAYVAGKIQDVHEDGGSAADVKAAIASPDPHETSTAAIVSAIVEAQKFPSVPTPTIVTATVNGSAVTPTV